MLLLRRYKENHTEGKLIYPDDSHTYCLERPWLNNKPSISCIPEGKYLIDRDKHGRFQWYKVREGQIVGRTNIEIHTGNKVEHSEGCLLPCMELKDGFGSSSRIACEKLLEWFGDDSFWLEIRKYNPFQDGKC
jgi:hypothetical protein